MSGQPVRYEVSAGVMEIVIDRPGRANALDPGTVEALDAALARAGEDDAVRAALLRGEGRHFCAGADVAWLRDAGADGSPERNLSETSALAEMLLRIRSLPKPVVVAAHGACMAGGIGLCCAADVCVADATARFRFVEARLGLEPSTVAPHVVRAVGARQALRLFLTGETVGADAARDLGIVHAVVGEGRAPEVARALCGECLQGGPRAIASTKGLVALVEGRPVDADLSRLTAERLSSIRSTDEAREGVRALLEKRPPGWAKPRP